MIHKNSSCVQTETCLAKNLCCYLTVMGISNIILYRFCVSFSFTLFLVCSLTNGIKIVLPLIHHNSILSPFYKSKLSVSSDDITAQLAPDRRKTIFLVNVSIGSPPVPQLLGMDTGSMLTWVCTTCNPGLGPAFDPKRSSTYSNISCSSIHQCLDYFHRSNCGFDSQCSYQISYADMSHSNGILATDKFTFATSSESVIELPDVVFGCGLENKWNVGELTGVFGLEPSGRNSLITLVGNRFSYCLGNISDPFYMYNKLVLGKKAEFEGPSTTMMLKSGHFTVNFRGISVSGKRLKIDANELGYNTVIDSGTTLMLLTQPVYDRLREEIMNLMDGLMQSVKIASDGERVCYFGDLARDMKGFPVVSLHLGEGVDLDLNVEALFQRRSESVFCLAVDVAFDGVNIIGVYAQQYYNVAFDLNQMKVSFQNIDCVLLED